MEHLFLNLFQTHLEVWRSFGYSIVTLVAFIESIPVIGMFIPGQIIIILAGFLVKLKVLSFPYTLSVAIAGAVLGDMTGFLIGKKYRHRLPKFIYALLRKEHLEKTQHLIEKHSFKTIFIGRLHSLTRTITPFAAGTTSISFRKFLVADVLSAIVWALLSILIGYVFGKSFELAASFIGKFILVATIVVVVLIVAVKFMHKHRHRISWTDFSLYATSAVFAYLFAVTADEIARGRLFDVLDARSIMLIVHIRTPVLTYFATLLSTLGDLKNMIIFTVTLTVWLAFKRHYVDALLAPITMATGLLSLDIVKSIFEKKRPLGLIDVYGSSFPSGHATMSIILATLISYTLIRHIGRETYKNMLYISVFALAIAVGLSRVYLNVHWTSDVIAGFFAGGFFATLMISIVRLVSTAIIRLRIRHELPNLP